MTLGRTSSGAIKIKTDGGLRAVECACCGGECYCGSMPLGSIIIPSDPDFAKKLKGEDQTVTPFTQVSVSYSITSEGYSHYETWSAGWIGSGVCEQDYNIKKFVDFPEPKFGFSDCGSYIIFLPTPPEPVLSIFLKNDGCLAIYIYDGIYGGGFGLLGSPCPDPTAPENTGQASILVNGVSLPTQIFDMNYSWRPDQSVSGNISLVFS